LRQSTSSRTSSPRTPRVAGRQRPRSQEHHGPHDLVGQRLADPGGVAAQHVALQLGELVGLDADGRQGPEPGRDAVHGAPGGDVVGDALPALGEQAGHGGVEREGGVVAGDGDHVVDGEGLAGEGEAFRVVARLGGVG
jgi:hypothetical protein